MFDRLTDRSRMIIGLARQHAQELKHDYVGTEHLLLGMIDESKGLACVILREQKVDLDKLKACVLSIVQVGPKRPEMGNLPFTPRSKRVFEFAEEIARDLGTNYIGTEHLLYGLAAEHEGAAAMALLEFGISADRAKKLVTEAILGQQAPSEATAQDLVERAWGVISNAGGGDWKRETKEWSEGAAKWRDDYHAWLKARGTAIPAEGAASGHGGTITVAGVTLPKNKVDLPDAQTMSDAAAFLKRIAPGGSRPNEMSKTDVDTLLTVLGEAAVSAPQQVRGAILAVLMHRHDGLTAMVGGAPTTFFPIEVVDRAHELLAEYVKNVLELGGKKS